MVARVMVGSFPGRRRWSTGVLTLTSAIGTGLVGISWSAAAAMASAVSIPEVTCPMIWYVL